MSRDNDVQAIIEECVPLIRRFAGGRYAISIGGSRGKGTADGHSDVDFRLFYDEEAPPSPERSEAWNAFRQAMEQWRSRGREIDGCWIRKIAAIDEALDAWIGGQTVPQDIMWTIWGYYLLPDIYHQQIVEDPYGVIAGWKDLLKVYPPVLKKAVVDKHMGSLRYWRNDYHYVHKVQRQDVVFLAGLSARLVHDLNQVLFALNETYYVGDGSNLEFIARFQCRPQRFAERVRSALYPPPSEHMFESQRSILVALIDEVEKLVASEP